MQGSKTCRALLLLFVSLWIAGCGTQPTASPTPKTVEVPVEVTVEVTRVITQQVTQHIVAAATPQPPAPCAATQPGEGSVATIGAILPLSSPGAFLAGYAMQTALNVAVTEINEQGGVQGVPVRLVTYDSAGIPERSAQFTERLILLDCALAITGFYHSGDALAALDVAHRYGVPIIVAEAGADEITARGYPEVFRIAPTHTMLAQAPATWLKEVGDYNADGELNAAIITENASTLPAVIEIMHTRLVDSGIATELLRVDLPATDFSSAIARLVALERLPDAIFITIKGEPALRLQSQLLEAGISPQRSTLIVQAHSGLDSTQFWGEVPNGNGTVVTRIGAWASTLTEHGLDFATKYEQIMGRWPESYAFASYDALWLLASTLKNAPGWGGSDLVTTLELAEMPSTSGSINFAVNSSAALTESQPASLWHQWEGGQILYLQYSEANQAANAMPVIWPPTYRQPDLETAVISTTP